MKLKYLGIFGIISLLSYTAMVVFSPLAYPGYDWLGMAVSDLSADGAPSQALAEQLNALFIVSIMAVCVAVSLELISSKEAVGFYQKHGFEERPCEWDGPGMFKMIRQDG